MDGRRIRKEKVSDSKISGYVSTWPKLNKNDNIKFYYIQLAIGSLCMRSNTRSVYGDFFRWFVGQLVGDDFGKMQ